MKAIGEPKFAEVSLASNLCPLRGDRLERGRAWSRPPLLTRLLDTDPSFCTEAERKKAPAFHGGL